MGTASHTVLEAASFIWGCYRLGACGPVPVTLPAAVAPSCSAVGTVDRAARSGMCTVRPAMDG